MSTLNSALAIFCTLLICLGQLLFKQISIEISNIGTWVHWRVFLFAGVAFTVYGGATLLWIYLLRFVELNRAYPFMALSFVILPSLSHWLFDEKLTIGYFIGSVLLINGIIIINRYG
jgi:drug/metabolite transporter (DMT)-like permease